MAATSSLPPQLTPAESQTLIDLSVRHAQLQVVQAAQTQNALRQLWDIAFRGEPELNVAFTRFALGATRLIQAARSRGQITATQYYMTSREIAMIDDELADVELVSQSTDADLAAIYSTASKSLRASANAGRSDAQALQFAQVAMLGAAKRRILEAGRQRVIDLSGADRYSHRWARVGDGNPCYFCAMLIGRGPVYSSESTADFRAHDHCGCGAMVVFRNDPSHGWTDLSKALNTAWYDMGSTQLSDWRDEYARITSDPDHAVTKALSAPATTYATAA